MRPTETTAEAGLEQVRQAYREAHAESHRQREALAALRELLGEMAARDLELHRRTLATVQALNRDLRRFERQLRNLSSARS